MEQYTIYCTESQTRKAIELGAPIMKVHNGFTNFPHYKIGNNNQYVIFILPTAEQMICWLEEQGCHFYIYFNTTWNFDVDFGKYRHWTTRIDFPSRKEATLAAIDEALEYLTNNKNVI